MPHHRHHRLLTAALGLLAPALTAADMSPAQRTFFETKIRPVLVKQCYECHSAGAKKIGGKLLLDSPAEMLGGGESGPAMIPDRPDESLIIQALRYDGLEMPPRQRLPDAVVQDFVTWVKMGAPDPRAPAAGKPAPAAPVDRAALWAYQPVQAPVLPAVRRQDWPRDALDRLVLAGLEARGLAPVADAPPAVLIRRLHADLVGLPPTAEDVQAFVQEHAQRGARAVESLVDRLLASPHFGERWGRHWLDVARYGESNGNDGLSRNPSFPHAWRYRDYVIRAFNDDTPYDRFLTEQIAGDLLPAGSPAQRDRQLTATGFLALGAKPAKAMNENFEMDVVADQVGLIGSAVLGLSVGCARCHDHKTDPIPTRDYYALAGIFKSTETLWGAAAYEGLTAPQTALHELQAAHRLTARPETEQLILARSKKKAVKASFAYAPDAPLAMGVRDAKAVADCRLNIGGEAKRLGPAVPRGFLSAGGPAGMAIPRDSKQSGRLQLAQWLTHPQHPQTARVMANRLWLHLFGEGLAPTPDDLGVSGERPAQPQLLDHLAERFIRGGWSVKRLIRDLVLSRTYQLDSRATPALRAADPENRLLGRHARRRLDAEALRDALLAVSGGLDRTPGRGSLIQQQEVLINQLGDLHQPSPHRSVYLLLLRNSMPAELTPFNLPDGTAVTGRRDRSTLATQALHLLNHPFVVEQARRLAERVQRAAAEDAARITAAYRFALAREPAAAELDQARDFLREADLMLASSRTETAAPAIGAWAAFCQALRASNERRYID